MPRERRRYVASPTRQRRVSSNDPQTLFLIDSQQPSHLGTPPTSPRRKRSPRSRSGWSRTSRRNTSRIARASSTSPRCAPRSHRSPAQLCAPHRRLQIDPPPRTRPRTNAPPFAIEPLTRHPLTHTPTPHTPPPTHAQIVCGDSECAPIDTAVRIIYEGKDDGAVGTAFAFPCTAVELTKEALDERMPPAETYEDWYEGRPRTGRLRPKMSSCGSRWERGWSARLERSSGRLVILQSTGSGKATGPRVCSRRTRCSWTMDG